MTPPADTRSRTLDSVGAQLSRRNRGDVLNDGRLLVLERGMAIQTHPDMFVFGPIRLEERICIGLRMNAGFPFLINFQVTFAA